MKFKTILISMIIVAAIFAKERNDSTVPKLLPPVLDADPSIRENREFQLPSVLNLISSRGSNALSIDSSTLKDTLLEIGFKMVSGFSFKTFAVNRDERKLLSRGLTTSKRGLMGTETHNNNELAKLLNSPECFFEVVVELFETDIPSQHMWSPASEKFRILWSDTLRTDLIRINRK